LVPSFSFKSWGFTLFRSSIHLVYSIITEMAFPSDILPNQFLHWNLNLKSEPVNMGFLYPPLDGAAFPPIDETLHIQVPNQIYRIPSTSSTASYTSESSTSTYPPIPTFLDQTEALPKSEDRHLASTANRSARRENRRFDPYNSSSTAHRGWYPGTGTGAGDLMVRSFWLILNGGIMCAYSPISVLII
jgi:hypothetical protein